MLDMQQLLDTAEAWAKKVTMEWAIKKSCDLSLHGLVTLNGGALPDKEEEIYLGVSFDARRVTDSKLIERIKLALQLLRTLRNITKTWKLSVRQRRTFVKTFVHRKCDYVLFLQPLSREVRTLAADLDCQCAAYVLGAKVQTSKTNRACAIAKLLPLHARRKRHLVKLVTKFLSRWTLQDPSERDIENWKTIKQYDTIRPFVARKVPSDSENIWQLSKAELCNIYKES